MCPRRRQWSPNPGNPRATARARYGSLPTAAKLTPIGTSGKRGRRLTRHRDGVYRGGMTETPTDDAYTIRPAVAEDAREVAALWCEAFPGRRTVEQRVRMLESGGRYGGLETVLVMRSAEGALAGAAKLYRLEGHVAGVALPAMGLAAVAVAPAYRRHGLGARLCTHAIHTAADRGDAVSMLYPFRPDYYERLGWGLVGELHDYRFNTDALPTYREAHHVRVAADDADRDAIAACYARVAARSNGPISRDRRVWSYRLAAEELGVRPLDADGGLPPDPKLRAVVFDDDGVTGYALLRHVTRRNGGERRLEVRELVAESERAYRGLLGHIADQGEAWPRARHFARPEERFGDRLRDPRPPGSSAVRSLYFPTARIVRGPMLRVLDVAAALRARSWFDAHAGRGPAATLRITVRDPQRPENEGPWAVRLDGAGGALVEAAEPATGSRGEAGGHAGMKGSEKGGRPAAELSTSASTFARMFAGDLAATDAARIGQAEIRGDSSLLDRAFATRERFWLLDEF